MKRKAVWISCIPAALFCGRSANASVIMTLLDVGSNVVATASGTLDLTDLTPFSTSTPIFMQITPMNAILGVGPFSPGGSNIGYSGVSAPSTFGTGGTAFASTATGNTLNISSFSLTLPQSYVSDTFLSGMSTRRGTLRHMCFFSNLIFKKVR
jgi:hypothetical protein